MCLAETKAEALPSLTRRLEVQDWVVVHRPAQGTRGGLFMAAHPCAQGSVVHALATDDVLVMDLPHWDMWLVTAYVRGGCRDPNRSMVRAAVSRALAASRRRITVLIGDLNAHTGDSHSSWNEQGRWLATLCSQNHLWLYKPDVATRLSDKTCCPDSVLDYAAVTAMTGDHRLEVLDLALTGVRSDHRPLLLSLATPALAKLSSSTQLLAPQRRVPWPYQHHCWRSFRLAADAAILPSVHSDTLGSVMKHLAKVIPSYQLPAVLQLVECRPAAVDKAAKAHQQAVQQWLRSPTAATRHRLEQAADELGQQSRRASSQAARTRRSLLQRMRARRHLRPMHAVIQLQMTGTRSGVPANEFQGQRMRPEQVREQWRQTFARLFTGPPWTEDLTALCQLPTITGLELFHAVQQLRRNTSPDGSGLYNELFINLVPPSRLGSRWDSPFVGQAALLHLAQVLDTTLRTTGPPRAWLASRTSLLYKGRGCKSDPANVRPITVMPALGKLLSTVLTLRLHGTVAQLHDCQAGFRPRRGVLDNVFVLHTAVDLRWRARRPTFAVLLDVHRAYDSVSHPLLADALHSAGVPAPLLAAVMMCVSRASTCVRLGGQDSGQFHLRRGVPQGSPLSPALFAVFIDQVIKQVNARFASHPDTVCLPDGTPVVVLLYADDILILGGTRDHVQEVTAYVELQLRAIDLRVQPKKCQAIQFHQRAQLEPLTVEAATIAWETQPVRYLGVMLDTGLSLAAHRQRVIANTRAQLQRLSARGILGAPDIPLRLAREYAAGTVLGFAEFCAPVITMGVSWHEADDVQVQAARVVLRLPKWSSRCRSLLAIGWVTQGQRARWARLRYYVHASLLPSDRLLHKSMRAAATRESRFQAQLQQDLRDVGLCLDGVHLRQLLLAYGSVAGVVQHVKTAWRRAAETELLHQVAEACCSDLLSHGWVLGHVHPPTAPPPLSCGSPIVCFQAAFDSGTDRAARIRAQLLAGTYPCGPTRAWMVETLGALPPCQMGDSSCGLCGAQCSVPHLLLECPGLAQPRRALFERLRVPPQVMQVDGQLCWVGVPLPLDMSSGRGADDALKVLMGGNTRRPDMLVSVAQQWGLWVPELPVSAMVKSVNLITTHEDPSGPLRPLYHRVRMRVNDWCAAFLVQMDDLFQAAMSAAAVSGTASTPT